MLETILIKSLEILGIAVCSLITVVIIIIIVLAIKISAKEIKKR